MLQKNGFGDYLFHLVCKKTLMWIKPARAYESQLVFTLLVVQHFMSNLETFKFTRSVQMGKLYVTLEKLMLL